ncbi:MAG: DUF5654 family protein [archaeon]|nr:DUF5654 family protein [archaeon]
MVDFDENDTFAVQVLEAMSALIISAFSLVAALAWNEAIKTAIANLLGTGDEGLGLFIYAIIVTIIAVIMAIVITRAIRKAKAAQKKKQ